MTSIKVRTIRHRDLSGWDLDRLRALFEREYFAKHGPWNPDAPFGYAPAELHIMAFWKDELVGHVGFQPRRVTVGNREVTVAGTGGMLVAPDARGSGLGVRLMRHAQAAMRRTPGIEFGYLGCRPAVVPFYEAAGWRRIWARERFESPHGSTALADGSTSPILVCAAARPLTSWPAGDIDLRGRPW